MKEYWIILKRIDNEIEYWLKCNAVWFIAGLVLGAFVLYVMLYRG